MYQIKIMILYPIFMTQNFERYQDIYLQKVHITGSLLGLWPEIKFIMSDVSYWKKSKSITA